MIAVYDEWENPIAWIYLGLHGTYGLLWLLKSRFFPDASWEQEISFAYGLATWLILTLYLLAPWLIVSHSGGDPEPWFIGFCVALYSFGVFFHYVSDMQKHLSLQWRPGTLITEGLWSGVRNPNYFGELCIYLGFGLLAFHWAPVAVIALVVAAVWYPNMRRKDASLSRYSEFANYRARTKLWIPYVW